MRVCCASGMFESLNFKEIDPCNGEASKDTDEMSVSSTSTSASGGAGTPNRNACLTRYCRQCNAAYYPPPGIRVHKFCLKCFLVFRIAKYGPKAVEVKAALTLQSHARRMKAQRIAAAIVRKADASTQTNDVKLRVTQSTNTEIDLDLKPVQAVKGGPHDGSSESMERHVRMLQHELEWLREYVFTSIRELKARPAHVEVWPPLTGPFPVHPHAHASRVSSPLHNPHLSAQ